MKYTWVDINDNKKQKVHFKPINESEKTPSFECRTNTIVKDGLKSQILAATIYDATMKLMESNHKPMVMESNDRISFMQT